MANPVDAFVQQVIEDARTAMDMARTALDDAEQALQQARWRARTGFEGDDLNNLHATRALAARLVDVTTSLYYFACREARKQEDAVRATPARPCVEPLIERLVMIPNKA